MGLVYTFCYNFLCIYDYLEISKKKKTRKYLQAHGVKVGEGSREGLGIMSKGLGLEDELHEGLEQGVVEVKLLR